MSTICLFYCDSDIYSILIFSNKKEDFDAFTGTKPLLLFLERHKISKNFDILVKNDRAYAGLHVAIDYATVNLKKSILSIIVS